MQAQQKVDKEPSTWYQNCLQQCQLSQCRFHRTRGHCWGRHAGWNECSYPSPERLNSALHSRNGPLQLGSAKAKNSAGSGLPPRGRCSAEALVTPRSLPRQCLKDVSGGVRVHQALCLPVGLLVLAQCCARFYEHVCAGSLSGCISLRLRVLGSHSRVLEGFVQPLLHALVLDHLVQLRVATIFDVAIEAIGCFDGLTCQQSSAEH